MDATPAPTTARRTTTRVLAVLHPEALAIAWVISFYATTGSPLWALWRPLLVVGAAVVLVQLVITLVLRRAALAAFVTSSAAMAAAGLWPIAAAIAAGTLTWLALEALPAFRRGRLRMTMGGLGDRMPVGMGALSLAVLALVIAQAGAGGAFWSVESPPTSRAEASASAVDMYVILLDGYPRADTLSSLFGIDNGAFLSELESRGFGVADDSRSNYSITWLTIASVLRMDYVHELPEVAQIPVRGPEQYRVLGRLVNESPALAELRRAGYEIVSSPSPFSELQLATADIAYPIAGITWLESELIRESPLSRIFAGLVRDWLSADLRIGTDVALERLSEVARRGTGGPVFMFDHVFSPHPPFIFEADGSARALPQCYPDSCGLYQANPDRLGLSLDEYGQALKGQITHLNERLLATLDRLIDERPDAVIVLFSDHGTRYSLGGDPDEATRNFFAARTPGTPGVFDETIHTVNLMPTLLNAYLGTDIPLREFRAWVSTGYPLQLQEQ